MITDEFNVLLKQYLNRKYPNVPKNVNLDKVSNLNLTVTQLTGLLQKYASSSIVSSDEKKLFNILKDDLYRDLAAIPDSERELKDYYNEVIRLADLAEDL